MPDSTQALLIILVTMPGFFGYLIFQKVYNRTVEDTFEKISYVVVFNAFPLFLLTSVGKISTDDIERISSFGLSDIITFFSKYFPAITFLSVASGLFCAMGANKLTSSAILIKYKLTNKTSHRSVISDVICNNPNAYLKFRLKNGGYVIGHPRKFSLDGEESAIFLENAARRPPKPAQGLQPPEQNVDGQGILFLHFDEVMYVEVL